MNEFEEMPEGFKRLKHSIDIGFANVKIEDLELIKEMVETFEITYKVIEENGLEHEVDPNFDRIGTVLNKFKEWK